MRTLALLACLLVASVAYAQTRIKGTGGVEIDGLITTGSVKSTAVNVSGTEIDPSTGSSFVKTLTDNVAFTWANLAEGQKWIVTLTQGGDGDYTVDWPDTDAKWPGEPNEAEPTMGIGVGTINVFQFMRQGGVTIGGVIQQPSATTYTVATLPASATTGTIVTCTDNLTPYGSGSDVRWDGSVWRDTQTRIAATDVLATFMLNALAVAYDGNSTITIARHADFLGGSTQADSGGTAAASGSGAISLDSVAGRNFMTFSTSTSATGQGFFYGSRWTPAAGDIVQTAADIDLSALSDDTEQYYVIIGFAASTSIPGNDGAFFLYDRHNALGYLGAGFNTNNWWTISRAGSANTTNDTGVAVDANWNRYIVQKTTTYDAFFLNGSMVWSNTTAVSSAQMYPNRVTILKGAGTTARQLNLDWINIQQRYTTARTFYP